MKKLRVAETVTFEGRQISFLDLAAAPKKVQLKPKAEKRKIAEIQSQLRLLQDELNDLCYKAGSDKPDITCPYDAYSLLAPFLEHLEHEELWVLILNTRSKLISLVKLYQGSTNMSQVRVCEVFRQAIADNACSIIVAHNHPSGDPTPSPEDVALTRVLNQAGNLLDIKVADHLVIGLNRYVSLKERGLGFS
jgi:DNA repair protein RadC